MATFIAMGCPRCGRTVQVFVSKTAMAAVSGMDVAEARQLDAQDRLDGDFDNPWVVKLLAETACPGCGLSKPTEADVMAIMARHRNDAAL